MLIRYEDGRNSEAVLISRTTGTMRVVLQGGADAIDLTDVNGVWLSENCEPVQVEFAWESRPHTAAPSVSDCVCSAELASTLVDLLATGSPEAESEAPPRHFSAGSPVL